MLRTITLGPAAASFAGILVVAGIEQRWDELDMSLRALVVSLPLTVAGFFLLELLDEAQSAASKIVLGVLGGLLANVGHLALVVGIYYLTKYADPEAARLFFIVGGAVYALFTLIFVAMVVWRTSQKKLDSESGNGSGR